MTSKLKRHLIPLSDIQSQIGKCVHVEGWHPGAVFRLLKIEEDVAFIETPTTRKQMCVKVSCLQYTRCNTPLSLRTCADGRKD